MSNNNRNYQTNQQSNNNKYSQNYRNNQQREYNQYRQYSNQQFHPPRNQTPYQYHQIPPHQNHPNSMNQQQAYNQQPMHYYYPYQHYPQYQPYPPNYPQYYPSQMTQYNHYPPNQMNHNQRYQSNFDKTTPKKQVQSSNQIKKNYNQSIEQKRNYRQRYGNKQDNHSYSNYKQQSSNKYNQKGEKRDEHQDDDQSAEIGSLPSNRSDSQQQSEEEQVIYRKKVITKKKDPIMDSKQQIRKWIEARKRNYPKRSINADEIRGKVQQEQLSILQKKIRKKILLVNADTKGMMKKLKDIDILRRFMLYSRRPRKIMSERHLKVQDKRIVETIKDEKQILKQQPKIIENIVQSKVQITNQVQQQIDEAAVEVPIKQNKIQPIQTNQYNRREQLSVDVIVKHLQMKQAEDKQTLQNLMDYKSNSFHFRYRHQTLQTNLLLDNIFNQTSYILQAIRYIVKNNFFQLDKLQ